MDDRPLVTIGMPVYNGVRHLRESLSSLLAQDYPHLEILVSDNCSTDQTWSMCQELAAENPRLRISRNAENLGFIKNFNLVVEQAHGKYFMWAAHDDRWDPCYVSSLVEQLLAEPTAVLATQTLVHMHEDGTPAPETPDRPATAGSNLGNLQILYDDHAPNWLYGLWSAAWLREHVAEFHRYPLWGGDVMWLADVCLRYPVVGSAQAVMYNRHHRSPYQPRSPRTAVLFWLSMFWHLSRISLRSGQSRIVRRQALWASWVYVYRLCIRRPNLPRTVWRVIRMSLLALLETGGWAIRQACRRLMHLVLPRAAKEGGA